MGRIRPNPASGIKPTKPKKLPTKAPSEVEFRDRSLESNKRPKLVENSDWTVPPPSHLFEAILHPMSIQEFVNKYWQTGQAMVIDRKQGSAWNSKLFSSLSSKEKLIKLFSDSSHPLYYHLDCQLMGYNKADDDIFFDTPVSGGKVELEKEWPKLNAGPDSCASIQITNIDLFSTEVKKLLDDIDSIWKGDGASTTLLQICGKNSMPFGPHLDGQCQFLIQIRGSQEVRLYKPLPQYSHFVENAGEENVFPSYAHGPDPELVFSSEYIQRTCDLEASINLQAGSILYVPKMLKHTKSLSEECIFLTVYLSPQQRWKSSINSLLTLAMAHVPEVSKPELSGKGLYFIEASTSVPPYDTTPIARKTGSSEEDIYNNAEDDSMSNNEKVGMLSDDTYNQSSKVSDWSLFPHSLLDPTNDSHPYSSSNLPQPMANATGANLKTALERVFLAAASLVPEFIKTSASLPPVTRGALLSGIKDIRSRIKHGNIQNLLAAHGGFYKLQNFFPDNIANAIHHIVSHVPEHEWVDAYSEDDRSENNIAHSFKSSRTFASHHALWTLFKRICPELLGDFSVGRYTQSHFIAPHDDKAYKEINGSHYSRQIAVIYYCSKDWQESYGGQLVDIVTGKKYTPEFNSLVAFTVPRLHQVLPVKVQNVSRFSVFGWFFKPGISYELDTVFPDSEDSMEAE